MAEPLFVDTSQLQIAGEKLTAATTLPAAPPPLIAPGADRVSHAINEVLPEIESPVVDALPKLAERLARTAFDVVTAAGIYTQADQVLGQRLRTVQFTETAAREADTSRLASATDSPVVDATTLVSASAAGAAENSTTATGMQALLGEASVESVVELSSGEQTFASIAGVTNTATGMVQTVIQTAQSTSRADSRPADAVEPDSERDQESPEAAAGDETLGESAPLAVPVNEPGQVPSSAAR